MCAYMHESCVRVQFGYASRLTMLILVSSLSTKKKKWVRPFSALFCVIITHRTICRGLRAGFVSLLLAQLLNFSCTVVHVALVLSLLCTTASVYEVRRELCNDSANHRS